MKGYYILNWDYSHSGDMERDAYHVKFTNSDKATTIFLNSKYIDKLPPQIVFNANFNCIPKIDYPLTDLNIPIMSEKMIETLKKSGEFNAIFTPVIMILDTYVDNRKESEINLNKNAHKSFNYKAMTLIDRENCFDYSKSEYEPSEINPKIPGYIKKIVLKYNPLSPPVFRIKEAPSHIFITQNTKELLESNNISGCKYEMVEVSCET